MQIILKAETLPIIETLNKIKCKKVDFYGSDNFIL